jgi:hypothetical protein
MTLAERITSVLAGTGFRPYVDMPLNATHHSGPFFLVAEGVGATVSVAWMDATDTERGAMLHRYAIRLHEVGLVADRRDGYLYVTEAEGRP